MTQPSEHRDPPRAEMDRRDAAPHVSVRPSPAPSRPSSRHRALAGAALVAGLLAGQATSAGTPAAGAATHLPGAAGLVATSAPAPARPCAASPPRQSSALVNNRYDPATPLRNAVAMNRLLPRSRLLTVDGWGHTPLQTRSACADGAIERYLVRLVLPRPGATCETGVIPFVEVPGTQRRLLPDGVSLTFGF